jgi:cell wall-associated NlpC family hydrolase
MFKMFTRYRILWRLLLSCCLLLVHAAPGSLAHPFHHSNSVPKFQPQQSFFYFGGSLEDRITKKYSDLLRVESNEISKYLGLYKFIDQWMGTPYMWGGCSRVGIDCSCFVMNLYESVFNIKIKRTTFTQFYDKNVLLFKNPNQYQLGDLLFFKTNINRETRNNRITHVGIYLTNGYFIQSSSAGVNIASVKSGYWKQCFVAAGRLQDNYYRQTTSLAMNTSKTKPAQDFLVEENSAFDPVPYPEDFEAIKENYASMLQVEADRLQIPEIFNYIEQNRYAPYKLHSSCAHRLMETNCFVTRFYKSIFNLDIDASTTGITSPQKTFKLKPNDVLSVLDLVTLRKQDKTTQKVEEIVGIYLYNSYFLYIAENDLAVSNLDNIQFDKHEKNYYRFDAATLKRAYLNLMELRKKRLGEDSLLRNDSVINILKKDQVKAKADSLTKQQMPKQTPIEAPKPKPRFKSNL